MEEKLITAIAWSIKRGKKKIKRKRWYNLGKEASIIDLYRKLLEKISEARLKELSTKK